MTAGRLVLLRRIGGIERQLRFRIQRRQVVEIDAVADGFGIVEVHRGELGQREIAFAILGRADLAFDGIARAQAVLAHLIGRHIDIVRTGEIVRFRRAQEAETVLQNLDRAEAHDLVAILRLHLQDREQQILLRSVEAPSTPNSSAMLTRSAGVFFFKSLRCME